MDPPTLAMSLQQQQQQRQQLDQQHADIMAAGLMPLPTGQKPLSKDVVPILQVYIPRPSTDKHQVQWLIPAAGPPAGATATHPFNAIPNPTAANIISSSGNSTSNSNSSSSSRGGAQVVLSDPITTTLSSKHSKHEAFVIFANPTPHSIRLLWVDYKGNEVSYDTLAPGQACMQQTFATHPWLAREVSTGTQLPINMQEAFCPLNIPRNSSSGQQQAAAARAPAAADAPAGPPGQDAAAVAAAAGLAAAGAAPAAAAAAGAANHPQQQQPELWVRVDGPTGPRRVPASRLQRAEVCMLPRLAWSEATHAHFPATFKASVRTFLLCHMQLQQQAPTCSSSSSRVSQTAGTGGPTGLLAAVAASAAAAATATSDESSASKLGSIPSLLLPQIVCFAAPFVPQHMGLPVELRPDVLPTVLPEDPQAAAVAGAGADADMEDAESDSDEGADADADAGVGGDVDAGLQ